MSGIVTPNMIEVRQGDSFTINIYLKRNCKEFDLTNWTCEMQVRNKDTKDLIFNVMGTPVELEHGKIALILTPDMTVNAVGDYECDIQIVSDTGEINTIYPADLSKVATFRITKQVTR